jgi:hypothetical protein
VLFCTAIRYRGIVRSSHFYVCNWLADDGMSRMFRSCLPGSINIGLREGELGRVLARDKRRPWVISLACVRAGGGAATLSSAYF